jgi:rubrerythrin
MASTNQERHLISELTIETVDRDGAIRETFSALGTDSRRDFLRKSVGGATLLGGLLALPAEASAATRNQDVAILNYALTLEYLQADFYTETQRLRVVTGQMARIARQLGAVERAHVRAIRKVLGSKAVKKPAFNFGGVTEDPDKFLKTAVAFEDLAVEAYKGQAPRVKAPALLAAAVAIHSVEARHAAWMRYLVGIQPAAKAFDDAKPIGQVRRIVASTNFVVARPRKTGRGKPRFTG